MCVVDVFDSFSDKWWHVRLSGQDLDRGDFEWLQAWTSADEVINYLWPRGWKVDPHPLLIVCYHGSRNDASDLTAQRASDAYNHLKRGENRQSIFHRSQLFCVWRGSSRDGLCVAKGVGRTIGNHRDAMRDYAEWAQSHIYQRLHALSCICHRLIFALVNERLPLIGWSFGNSLDIALHHLRLCLVLGNLKLSFYRTTWPANSWPYGLRDRAWYFDIFFQMGWFNRQLVRYVISNIHQPKLACSSHVIFWEISSPMLMPIQI